MKTAQPLTSFSRLFALVATCASCLLAAGALRAQDRQPTGIVQYAPSLVQIQDAFPFTRSYSFQLTSPASEPPVPTPITFAVTTNGVPPGVTDATALSYISIAPVDPFTAPNQTRTVTVTMTVPASATPGPYGYKILATGWRSSATNFGTFINATITASAQSYTPPVVTISTPNDGGVVTVPIGGLPVSVPFSFAATGPGPYPSPIDSLSYSLDGAIDPISISSLTGLNTLSVSGAGTLLLSTAGQHVVTVSAHNAAGTASNTHTFNVVVDAPPPTVTIDAPANGASYDYYAGRPELSIPFQFTGRSTASVISALAAQLDGEDIAFTATGLNTAKAVGTTTFTLSAGGPHTLLVTARDAYGHATSTSTFTINVITPRPVITIDNPVQGQTFEHLTGTPALDIPFRFYANASSGFTISSVRAELDGAPVLIDATTGLDTASTTSTGTLPGVNAGTHVLTAYGISGGVNVSTSVTFVVKEVSPSVPPSVVINTPAVGAIYTLSSGKNAKVTVPLNFTGTSNVSGGVIKSLTATLDGSPVSVSWPSSKKSSTATGTASVAVTTAGEHTFTVTATDAVGTATATRIFNVVAATQKTLSGSAFFDVNANGKRDSAEPSLAGLSVKLYDSTGRKLQASTATSADGTYSFDVSGGSYLVVVTAPTGLSPTTINEHSLKVSSSSVSAPATGFGLNFNAIRTLSACALSHGFWKTNLSKALSGKKNGTQVNAADLQRYTATIGTLALEPFDGLTLSTAVSVLSGKSQLQLQLLAAEYNYVKGAYIGGSQTLTYAFIYWGEAVLKNAGNYYDSKYQNFGAQWFEAYNTSECGKVQGPLPSGSSDCKRCSKQHSGHRDCDDHDDDRKNDRDCQPNDRDHDRNSDCDNDRSPSRYDSNHGHSSSKDNNSKGHSSNAKDNSSDSKGHSSSNAKDNDSKSKDHDSRGNSSRNDDDCRDDNDRYSSSKGNGHPSDRDRR